MLAAARRPTGEEDEDDDVGVAATAAVAVLTDNDGIFAVIVLDCIWGRCCGGRCCCGDGDGGGGTVILGFCSAPAPPPAPPLAIQFTVKSPAANLIRSDASWGFFALRAWVRGGPG